MEQIVITHAQRTPHVLAVENGAQRLAYADLVCEAHCLANSVRVSEDISFGEPFGILLGIGAKQVVAQVGIRLLGGTCAPIELSASIPPQGMIEMLNRANVQRVVVDAEASRNEMFSALKLSELRLFCLALGSGKDFHVDLFLEDLKRQEFPNRIHILFTSGSTGNPKPVQIRASGILHLARQTPFTPLMSEDQVADFNNPWFNLSLFEIWVTLVAGATIVAIPRQTATDPHALPSFLEDRGITIIITTAAQNSRDSKSQDTWTAIVSLWKDTLNITDINDEDDFFLLGGKSLLAASLIANIRRKLGHIFTMEDLTGNSRLGDLVHIIQGSQEKADGGSFRNAPDHSKLWLGDIDLVNDIELVPSWNTSDEGRVFFTGATGFTGAHLLRELMLSPTVKQSACLVRAQPDITAPQRVQRTLKKYDLWPDSSEYTEKVLLLEGDLPDEFLGLGKEKFNWLSN